MTIISMAKGVDAHRTGGRWITCTDDGRADSCSSTDDRRVFARINRLLVESLPEPGVDIGTPEPLGQNRSGPWSGRITDEYRLVYKVGGDSLGIIATSARLDTTLSDART
jgi:toxin YoeB